MEYAAPARTERDVTGLLDMAGHALPNRLAAAQAEVDQPAAGVTLVGATRSWVSPTSGWRAQNPRRRHCISRRTP